MTPMFPNDPNYLAAKEVELTVSLKKPFAQLFPDPEAVLCQTTAFRDNSHIHQAIPPQWDNRPLGFYLAGAYFDLKAAVDRWSTRPSNLNAVLVRLKDRLGKDTPPNSAILSEYWAIVYAGAARVLKLNDPAEEYLLLYHLGRAEKWLACAICAIHSFEEGEYGIPA